MRRWLVLGAAIGLAGVRSAAPLAAQKLFQGTITYEVTPAGGTPVEMILRSNGRKLREDMRAPGTGNESTTYQVIDGESGDVLVVIPAARQYMLRNVKKLRAESGVRGDTDSSRANDLLADIVATGRKETIAGLSCEVYVRKSRPGMEWCLTTALGRIGALDDQLTGGNAMSRAMQPFTNGALPLRMTAGAATGHPMTMIATKVDRATPPASLFTVPAGFVELKNPMMPNP